MKQWLKDNPSHLNKLYKNLELGRTKGVETKRIRKENGFQYTAPNKGCKTSYETKEKQRISALKRGRNSSMIRKVYQYNTDGTFIREWESGIDAARKITGNYKLTANIYQTCKGIRPTAMGFVWKYDKI